MSFPTLHSRRDRRCAAATPLIATIVFSLVAWLQPADAEAGQADTPVPATAEKETPAREAPQDSGAAKPLYEFRMLYAPGHFGNSYEVMGENEMRELLAEARFWGVNRYCDWFDKLDCSDPFAQNRIMTLSHSLWDTKKANYRSAGRLGLPCDLVLTPNHVYLDQCLPDLQAEMKRRRIFGQLICPSKPKARAFILRNYERLFADLARGGTRLVTLCPCPYDDGGCDCRQCKPWILTWAKLVREIHQIAKKYHPDVEMHMVGWWWEPKEHEILAEWADREAPGWVKTIYLYIKYGENRVPDVVLPRGCRRGAFVHIGYCDKKRPPDIYGMVGPVIAPNRLPKTIDGLRRQGVTRLMAYSEGVHDDLNKALYAGLCSGKYRTADDVLRAYARRYFGVDQATAQGWAEWLKAWGSPYEVNTTEARKELDRLLADTPKRHLWRVQQWVLKLELFRLYGEIAKGNRWTPERLALVEEFWAVREKIHRGLWGLGLQRKAFHRQYCGLPWYKSWAKHVGGRTRKLGKQP